MTETDPPSGHALSHAEVLELVAAHRETEAADPAAVEARRPADEAAAGLLAELNDGVIPDFVATGYELTDVWHLFQVDYTYQDDKTGEQKTRKVDYRAAVPILLKWLPKVGHPTVANGIVRALSFSFAKKQARPALLEFFRNPPHLFDPRRPDAGEVITAVFREAVATALATFADPSVATEYLDLAQDRSYGASRADIVAALPKLKDDRALDVLLNLLDDPAVAASSLRALGKLRRSEARGPIQEFLDNLSAADWSSDTLNLVRAEGKKALTRLVG
ncbi:hypothetical protein [Amycolatopsis sp. NPDC059657]|uniref:hypothetical protein n=1 Tax=Amycolatopsis sp. NPDC059657 TaxID=3346899 RepID=UPI00366FD9B1